MIRADSPSYENNGVSLPLGNAAIRRESRRSVGLTDQVRNRVLVSDGSLLKSPSLSVALQQHALSENEHFLAVLFEHSRLKYHDTFCFLRAQLDDTTFDLYRITHKNRLSEAQFVNSIERDDAVARKARLHCQAA